MSDSEATRASRQQERVVAEFRANAGEVGGYHTGMPRAGLGGTLS